MNCNAAVIFFLINQRAELEDLGELLGRRPAGLAEGHAALVSALPGRTFEDAAAIRYLARKSYRDEWLYAPAAALYPERRWAPLD